MLALCTLLITVYVSYRGIRDRFFLDRYAFQVDRILLHREYHRLFTSGFLHTGWMHLFFNMLALYSFADELEARLGILPVVFLYVGSLLGGNLLALFIHRRRPEYTAVGASGAVCGVIFASIALFPGMYMGLLFIPFQMPGWLFGLLYVAYTLFGIQSRRDNIGHEAHLGGGLAGMLIAITLDPDVLQNNLLPIALIAVPSFIFLWFVVTRPEFLVLGTLKRPVQDNYTKDDRYNARKRYDEQQLDSLLEKIHRTGIDSLTKQERARLEELSNGKR